MFCAEPPLLCLFKTLMQNFIGNILVLTQQVFLRQQFFFSEKIIIIKVTALSCAHLSVTQQVDVLVVWTEHHVSQDRLPLHHRHRLVQQSILGWRRDPIHTDLKHTHMGKTR